MGTAGLIFLASVVLFGVGAFMARSEEKRARRLVGEERAAGSCRR